MTMQQVWTRSAACKSAERARLEPAAAPGRGTRERGGDSAQSGRRSTSAARVSYYHQTDRPGARRGSGERPSRRRGGSPDGIGRARRAAAPPIPPTQTRRVSTTSELTRRARWRSIRTGTSR
jgi:hypothetical protein